MQKHVLIQKPYNALAVAARYQRKGSLGGEKDLRQKQDHSSVVNLLVGE